MSLLKGLSLFANIGVAEAYLKNLGIDIVVANEIDKDRATFYQQIYKDTTVIIGDIKDNLIRDKIVNEALEKKVDFIMATPPCQGMSEAGLRLEMDPRNQLISYAIEVIKRVKPKFVLLENVPTQLITKIQYYDEVVLIPEYIKRELGQNYRFNKDIIIKMKDYGIPQMRERNIFLLVRLDYDYIWEFPEKTKEITLSQAIGHLPSLDPKLREGIDLTQEKFPNFESKMKQGLIVSKWHYPPTHSWRQVEWMLHTPTGKSAIYNEKYFPKKIDGTRVKAHHNNYRRLRMDMPCRTITQNNGVISSLACVHPGRKFISESGEELYSDPRVLTIYELMIIMTIPLKWNIPSWASETLIRRAIGEGIPSKIIKDLMQVLINKIKEDSKWGKL